MLGACRTGVDLQPTIPKSDRLLVTDNACASSKVCVCLRIFGPGREDSPLQAFDETRSVFSVEQHAALSIDHGIGLSGQRRRGVDSQRIHPDCRKGQACDSHGQKKYRKRPLQDEAASRGGAPLLPGHELDTRFLTPLADVLRISVLVTILAINGCSARGADS